jgi:polygalacturonase
VKAYGASGNGIDDTASIHRAINASLCGGGIVYLPAGKYFLKGTLTNSRADLISLVGSGMGTES